MLNGVRCVCPKSLGRHNFIMISVQPKYFTFKPWWTETPTPPHPAKVEPYSSKRTFQNNGRKTPQPTSICGQNSKGKWWCACLADHWTTLFQRKQTHSHVVEGLQPIVEPLHRVCPTAYSINITFHTLPHHKRATIALSSPKSYPWEIYPAQVSIPPTQEGISVAWNVSLRLFGL